MPINQTISLSVVHLVETNYGQRWHLVHTHRHRQKCRETCVVEFDRMFTWLVMRFCVHRLILAFRAHADSAYGFEVRHIVNSQTNPFEHVCSDCAVCVWHVTLSSDLCILLTIISKCYYNFDEAEEQHDSDGACKSIFFSVICVFVFIRSKQFRSETNSSIFVRKQITDRSKLQHVACMACWRLHLLEKMNFCGKLEEKNIDLFSQTICNGSNFNSNALSSDHQLIPLAINEKMFQPITASDRILCMAGY